MPIPTPAQTSWQGDPDTYGIRLDFNQADYYLHPDTRDRIRRIILIAAEHFGRDPNSLAGMRLLVQSQWKRCISDGLLHAGCYEETPNTATVSLEQTRCIEDSLIAHELLHYWIHDWDHTSPLWQEEHAIWLETVRGTDCPYPEAVVP
jgi:hypothetical protein